MSTLTRTPTGLPDFLQVSTWLDTLPLPALEAALAWCASRPVAADARRLVNSALGFGPLRFRMEDLQTRITCAFRPEALDLARGDELALRRLDEVVYYASVVAHLERWGESHNLAAFGVHEPFLSLLRLAAALEAEPRLREYVVSLAGGWTGSLDDLLHAARSL